MKYFSLLSLLFVLSACDIFAPSAVQQKSEVPQQVQAEQGDIKENAGAFRENENRPSHEKIFDSHVDWPAFDHTKSVYVIKSGTGDDGAWFEGRGYFKFDLNRVIEDMSNPMKMGPSNVTPNLSRKDYIQTTDRVDYLLHVAMDYIMTVEFDLTVHLDIVRDSNQKISDIVYDSHKTSGTSLIKRIDEYYIVHALDNGWFSIEFQSLTDAMVTKEDETRAHFEQLFAEWEKYE